METIENFKAAYKRELNRALLTIEADGLYIEDYQIRMLRDNNIQNLLEVKGIEMDGTSIYEYDISGKMPLKSLYTNNKMKSEEMKKFLQQISGLVDNMKEYLLDENRLLLNPEYIFYEEGKYYFCYYPPKEGDIWNEFHRLMEFFVQWTDYQDTDSIKTAFMLHKETMEENYSLKRIMDRLQEETKESPQIREVLEDIPETSYETAEHDWITSQEMGSRILKETDNLWTPVRRFLQKHKKPKWGDWDGIYIEEDEL